jgi:hypothetical protein
MILAARASLLAAALAWLAACIPIPYKPSATVAPDAAVVVAPETVVSCGEDEATEALAKKIAARDRTITVAARQDLAAVAFPNGDSTVGELTDPAQRSRISGQSRITYLVLLGDVTETETSRHGGFIPLLGAGTWTSRTDVSACIIDLTDGRMLTGINAATEARSSGVIYGFYGVFLVPLSESSVYDAVADSVVAAIRAKTPQGEVTIAIARATGLQESPCPGGENCQVESPGPVPAN